MDVSITIPAQTVTIPEETVSVTIPVAGIVYQNSWLGQTSALSVPDMYTITATGQYRVSLALYASNTSGNTYVTATVSYPTSANDFNQLEVEVTASQPNVAEITGGSVGSFEGISGLSIPLTVTFEDGILNHYDVYVTIEQLQ